jgi:hypothetical protein
MTLRGLEPRRNLGGLQALRELKESGGLPASTGEFVDALVTMNKAARGFDVEPAVAANARQVGAELLAELRRLAAE